MDVMIGLLRPSSEKIMIDKKNFNVIDENSWKSKIDMFSKSFFVKGTILQNIAFGLDNKKIDTACKIMFKIVNMTNFINKLSKGLTQCRRNGSQLIEEKQRRLLPSFVYRTGNIVS